MDISGEIYDSNTGNLINNGTIQEIDGNGNNVGSAIIITDGSFSIPITSTPDGTIYYFFSSPGYNMFYASQVVLATSEGGQYNVKLTPSATATAASSSLLLPLAAGAILLMAVKKKKTKVGSLKTEDIVPFVIIGGVLLIISAGNKILETLGITDSPDMTAVKAIETNPTSFWNPNFYKTYTSYTTSLTSDQANTYADTLYNGLGFLSPDLTAITGVIHALQTQSELSYIADVFQAKYNQDLLTYLDNGSLLQTGMSAAEIVPLNTFISSLPTN
jgi:hypothetical protein